MSGIFSGVINQGSTFGIQTATIRPNPVDGLAYQIFFDAGGEYISVGDGKIWRDVKGSTNTYTFGSGLTLAGRNVTNNLTTGKSAGNIIFGFDDDLSGSGLQLWSASETGINSNYILFGSWDDNGTAYFSNTGAWNFGAETDPSLTTPYLYVFQSRGVFNARWDFNANIALINTTGSHIQSVWQTTAPTGNANQTHLFFDSVGSPSFRIGTNNWFKFTPNTLTANRNYALQDFNYTLAGIDIAQTFSALQTFSAGAAFGASIQAQPGSVGTPSINFGTANTGLFGNSANLFFSIAGTNRLTVSSTITLGAQTEIYSTFNIRDNNQLVFNSTSSIRAGTGTPEGAITANVGSLYLRTNGGANTTLYVKESGTGNTGWVAK